MARPARLAVLSAMAAAVLGASALHLLWRPPATPAAPGRTVVVSDPILDPTERVVLDQVGRAGLRVTSLGRLQAPVSRTPLVITTTSGILVVTDSAIACLDAPAVARAVHVIGNEDPGAPDRLYVGRIAGAVVFTGDSDVWAAVDAEPC